MTADTLTRPIRNDHAVSWESDNESDLDEAQPISGSNIDPAKLRTLLRIKFGGAYEIHVSANLNVETPGGNQG
jgi:hypothetical protein